MADKLLTVPYGDICRDPDQPRKHFDQDKLESMADSISKVGLIQPIKVALADPNDERLTAKYKIMAGERRWRACGLAGLLEVPVLLTDMDDPLLQAQIAFRENNDRENLRTLETAEFILNLQNEFCLSGRELSEELGISRAVVQRLLKIATSLSTEAKEYSVEVGLESDSILELIARVEDDALHLPILKHIVSKKLTRAGTASYIKNLVNKRDESTDNHELDIQLKRVQRMVGEQTGYDCKLSSGTSGDGVISLKFSSVEQLQGILERLGVSEDSE